MFWKTKSPQQKLQEEIAEMYQSTVNLALNQSSEPFMKATYVRMAIQTCNDTAKSKVGLLAKKYNLSEGIVWSIIVDSNKSAIEYFIK